MWHRSAFLILSLLFTIALVGLAESQDHYFLRVRSGNRIRLSPSDTLFVVQFRAESSGNDRYRAVADLEAHGFDFEPIPLLTNSPATPTDRVIAIRWNAAMDDSMKLDSALTVIAAQVVSHPAVIAGILPAFSYAGNPPGFVAPGCFALRFDTSVAAENWDSRLAELGLERCPIHGQDCLAEHYLLNAVRVVPRSDGRDLYEQIQALEMEPDIVACYPLLVRELDDDRRLVSYLEREVYSMIYRFLNSRGLHVRSVWDELLYIYERFGYTEALRYGRASKRLVSESLYVTVTLAGRFDEAPHKLLAAGLANASRPDYDSVRTGGDESGEWQVRSLIDGMVLFRNLPALLRVPSVLLVRQHVNDINLGQRLDSSCCARSGNGRFIPP